MTNARILTALLACALSSLSVRGALSQQPPPPSLEVLVPEGAERLATFDSHYYQEPVWCGSKIAAFLGYGGTPPTPHIRYYDIERKTLTDRPVGNDEGELLACNADGSRRATVLWESDSKSAGIFRLTSADGQRSWELARWAHTLLSADTDLRHFIFATYTYDGGWPVHLELVTAKPGSDGGVEVTRTQKFGDAPPDSMTRAAISPDGRTIAYSVLTTGDHTRLNDPSGLDLIVSPLGAGTVVRRPIDRILKSAATVKDFFFDRDKLVVVGASDDKKIVVATCPIEPGARGDCQSTVTDLNEAQFNVLGIGETGFIFGGGAPRACLFETATPNKVPPACQSGGAPGPRYCGLCYPVVSAVVSPDRRLVAVRSRHRGDGLSKIESEWTIVRMKAYRVK
jgi:hypothetical protein